MHSHRPLNLLARAWQRPGAQSQRSSHRAHNPKNKKPHALDHPMKQNAPCLPHITLHRCQRRLPTIRNFECASFTRPSASEKSCISKMPPLWPRNGFAFVKKVSIFLLILLEHVWAERDVGAPSARIPALRSYSNPGEPFPQRKRSIAVSGLEISCGSFLGHERSCMNLPPRCVDYLT
jgi:hypothetical protein